MTVPQRSSDPSNENSIIEVLKSLKFPREVVAPQAFDVHSSVSFKAFLKSFEKYFEQKFHGSDKEKSRQLGKFLRGRVKEAYNAMGGDSIRYRELKPMLLRWYNSEKGSSRQRYKEELDGCKMVEGSSVTIYCLKLERLARRVYPNSRRERERNLCMKAKSTFPPSLIEKINNAQGLAEAFGGQRITWHMIRKLAENHDRVKREKVTPPITGNHSAQNEWPIDDAPVCVVENPLQLSKSEEYAPHGDVVRKPRSFRNSSNSPTKRTVGPLSRSERCEWCEKLGHSERTCWLKSGACLLCGERDHYLRMCPRNLKRRSNLIKREQNPTMGAAMSERDYVQEVASQPPLNSNALRQAGYSQSQSPIPR